MATILLQIQFYPVKCVDHVSADLKIVWSFRRSFQKHKRYSNNVSRVIHELNDVLMSRRQFPDRQNQSNKYGLCLSSSKKYVVYADIGKHFLDHAVELVKSGKEII